LAVGLFLFVIGVFSIGYNRNHLLLILLRLELVIVGLFVIISLIIKSIILELLIFYLIIVVCEARLALRLLVLVVSFYGRDHIRSNSLLKC